MSKLGWVVTWNQDIDYIHPPANGDLPTIQEISNAFANVTADMLWVSAYDAITAVCIKIGTCEPRSVISRRVTLVETLARGSSLVVGHLGMQCWFCSACSSLYYATQPAHSKAIYTLYALVRTRATRSRRPPEPPCTPAVPVPMVRGVAKMGRHLYVSAKRCIYHSSVC
jgi:hypothetical protein